MLPDKEYLCFSYLQEGCQCSVEAGFTSRADFLMKNSAEGSVFMSVMLIFLCRKRCFYCPLYFVIYYKISGSSYS